MVKLQDMEQDANGQGKHKRTASFEKCVEYMLTLLDCVDHEKVEACSISLVPEQLRKSKVEAYTPRVVSIGPLHKGTRTDLLYMEEIKWRCVKHLFNRSPKDQEECLRKCSRAMLGIDEIVRASYNVDDVKFNRNDLAKIMVVDGCFLLELLISGSPDLNGELKCSVDGTSPGAAVIKREQVLSDLTMLENQIPLIVIDTLLKVLFPEFCEKVDCMRLIHKHALSILGYNYSDCPKLRAFHFLELVHSFIDMERDVTEQNDNTLKNLKVEEEEEDQDTKISIGNEQVADRKLKLGRCATRLEAAGVTIEHPEAKGRFDLKITFSERKLEIPQLRITETTEATWRNLIAWELNRTRLEKQRWGRTNEGEAGISCQFICYAWFIQSLICCVHDVKLLRDRGVIFADKADRDEDLMHLFRRMTEGVSDEIEMDSWFVHEIKKLNSYTTTLDHATENSRVVWHIFRCFLTWIWYKCRGSYRVLRRDYIPTGWGLIAVLAAAAGLALTAVQTHFSIH